MNNSTTYIINVAGDAQQNIAQIANATSIAHNKINGFVNLSQKIMSVGFAFHFVSGMISGLNAAIKGSIGAYNIQAQAETKLAVVMRQRMNATVETIDSIKKLASEQQKIGIIGDEVQLNGAQQLATFLNHKQSLEKLMPAMNNLLAQQRGINATSEDAVNIGNLMGKVMQGQTSALTRVGITFTEAEEKVLKYGNEQQRAAMLAQIITKNVGEMNKSIAATDEGKLKQNANAMGDLQERIGALTTKIQSALLPLKEKLQAIIEKIIDFFEKNKDSINKFISKAVPVIWKFIKIIGVVAASILTIKVAVGVCSFAIATWTALTTTARIVMLMFNYGLTATIAKIWHFNAAWLASPLTWVIASVIALIAAITYVAYKTEGWGKTWGNVMKYIKLSWNQAGAYLKLTWLRVENTFLTGFETIQKGWYKLKSLWDNDSANAALAKIQMQRDERARQIAIQKRIVERYSKEREILKLWEVKWNSNKKLSDINNSLRKKFGIQTIPTTDSSTSDSVILNDTGGIAESISGGGKCVKNFYITIGNLLGENTNYFSSSKDNPETASDFTERLSVALQDVVNDVNYAGS